MRINILPPVGSTIQVRAEGTVIDGTVIGHSEKDGMPIIDYLGPVKMSNGEMSNPTSRWAWPEQLV